MAGHSAGAITTLGLLAPLLHRRAHRRRGRPGRVRRYFGAAFAPPGVPTLFVHGTDDTGLPADDDRAVFEAYPGPAAFLELDGATHSRALR